MPVIADADTGYGNPLNVIRTVGAYEAAGVAGIHIEDQVAPKKCGHMEGKQVIPADEMAQKVRAAVEARTQPDFVIIARTDARAVEGLERPSTARRIIARPGPTCCSSRRSIARRRPPRRRAPFPACRCCSTGPRAARPRRSPTTGCKELGYRFVIFPISTLLAATAAMRGYLREIAATEPRRATAELPRSASSWISSGCPRCMRSNSVTPPKAGRGGPGWRAGLPGLPGRPAAEAARCGAGPAGHSGRPGDQRHVTARRTGRVAGAPGEGGAPGGVGRGDQQAAEDGEVLEEVDALLCAFPLVLDLPEPVAGRPWWAPA